MAADLKNEDISIYIQSCSSDEDFTLLGWNKKFQFKHYCILLMHAELVCSEQCPLPHRRASSRYWYLFYFYMRITKTTFYCRISYSKLARSQTCAPGVAKLS